LEQIESHYLFGKVLRAREAGRRLHGRYGFLSPTVGLKAKKILAAMPSFCFRNYTFNRSTFVDAPPAILGLECTNAIYLAIGGP